MTTVKDPDSSCDDIYERLIKDSTGKTALHYATLAGSEETILRLVPYCPNLLLSDKTTKTPKDYAKGPIFTLLKILESHQELDERRPSKENMHKVFGDVSLGREKLPVPVFNTVDDHPAPVEGFKENGLNWEFERL